MASTLTRFESSGFLAVGTPKTLVYAAPLDNKEALHHPIVDPCQTTRNYHGISEQMWRSMAGHVKMGTESCGGHFGHLL
jgi:hypothetical protein